MPRLAIVGCGAITESFYLPAFAGIPDMQGNIVLVDTNMDRCRDLAGRYGITNCSSDYREVLNSVQGVIVAAPHHLHYDMSSKCLSNGVHVLCEKPLTETVSQARELVSLAKTNKLSLLVNMTRRLMPSSVKVKELLERGEIGRMNSITYHDGAEFNWPTASGFYFDYRLSRRGVLMDIGSHILDLICWWTGGKPDVLSSMNDSFGGCEAVCDLRLDHKGSAIEVRMSRLSKLPNRYSIVGDRGSIHGLVYNGSTLTVMKDGKVHTMNLGRDLAGMGDYAKLLVQNFVDVLSKRSKPLIPAEEVLSSIELVEEAYAKATKFPLPWYEVREGVHEF